MQNKLSSLRPTETLTGSNLYKTIAVILSLALILMSVPALPVGVQKAEAVGPVHVSNLGQTDTNSITFDNSDDKIAQGFTTGDANDGYEFGSVVLDFVNDGGGGGDSYDLSIAIHNASGTEPGTKKFELAGSGRIMAGENIYDAPSNNSTLASGTDYYIVMSYDDGVSYLPDFSATTANGEDGSGDGEWSLADRYQYKDDTNDWSNGDGDYALQVGIYGPGAPAQITTFNAEGDDEDVDLSWTTSSYGGSSIIKHQYIQKLSSDSDWSGASWEDIPNSHKTGSNRKSYTVNDTTAGNQYDFKIRAINAVGTSTESAVASTYTQPATPVGDDISTFTVTENSILFSWEDPNNDSITNYRYRVDKHDKDSGLFNAFLSWRDMPDSHASTTSYNLTELDAATAYWIWLRAENDAGESDTYYFSNVTTSLPDAPGTPTGLATTSVNHTEVAVSWADPANSTITGYEYRINSDGTWTEISDSDDTSTTTTITGLSADTTYTLYIRAVNAGGNSGAAEISVTTGPNPQPEVPTNLTAIADGKDIILSWATSSDGGSPLTKHRYRYRTDDGNSWSGSNGNGNPISNSAPGEANEESFTLTGLSPSNYHIQIQATNAFGSSPWTSSVFVSNYGYPLVSNLDQTDGTTFNIANGERAAQSFTTGSSSFEVGSLTIDLDSVTDSGIGITLREDQNGRPKNNYFASLNHPTLVAGENKLTIPNGGLDLATNTTYWLQIWASVGGGGSTATFKTTAANAEDSGLTDGWSLGDVAKDRTYGSFDWDDLSDGRSLKISVNAAEAPKAPKDLTAEGSSGQIALQWATDWDGGLAITKHQYRRQLTGNNTWGAWTDIANSAWGETNEDGYTDTTVISGNSYTYEIRAVNNVGTGTAASVSANAGISPTLTADDDALKVGETTTITIEWDSPVQNFTEADILVTGTGTIGSFVASSTNAAYYSLLFTPASGVEATSTILSFPEGAAVDASDNSIDALGGSITIDSDTKRPEIVIADSGFYSDENYTEAIASASTVAKGDTIYTKVTFSEAVEWVSGIYVVDLSIRPHFKSTLDGSLSDLYLVLSPEAENRDINAVCRRAGGFSTDRFGFMDALDCFYTIPSDTTASKFGFTISSTTIKDRAGNLAAASFYSSPSLSGSGPYLNIQQPLPPATTTGLATTSVTNHQVALSWSNPNDSSITDYQYSINSGGLWTTISDSDADTTSHTITGLTGGTSYVVWIRAVNANGNSGYAQINVTTLPATVPDAPTDLAAKQQGPDIKLKWTASVNNGASINKYRYRYNTDGSDQWTVNTFIPDSNVGQDNETDYTLEGLTLGETYTIQVQAQNSVGTGPWTSSVTQLLDYGYPFVSNTGKSNSNYPGIIYDGRQEAQLFTVGDEDVYFGGVVVELDEVNTQDLKVSIRRVSGSGNPSGEVVALNNPSTISADKMKFTVPSGGQVLSSSTEYFVNLKNTDSSSDASTNYIKLKTTGSNDVNDGATESWDIDYARKFEVPGGGWGASSYSLKIQVLTAEEPETVTDLTATTTGSNGQKVKLDWSGGWDGGSPITKHQYRRSNDDGNSWQVDWTDIPNSGAGEDNEDTFTTGDLSSGYEYTFSVRAVNAVSEAAASNEVVVDFAAGIPTSIDLAADDDSGISNSDNITGQTTGLTVTGCAEANAIISFYDNGDTTLGTTTADGATGCHGDNKRFTKDLSLNEGRHLITTTATVGSNTSSSSIGLPILIDATAPEISFPDSIADITEAATTDFTIYSSPDTADFDVTFSDEGNNQVSKNNLSIDYEIFATLDLRTAGLSANLQNESNFGYGLDFADDLLVVGAPNDDTGGFDRGAVYILRDNNPKDGKYDGEDEIIVIDSDTTGITLSDNDNFGDAVAIHGDKIIVGAPDDGRGAIYILHNKNPDEDNDYEDTDEITKITHGDYGLSLASGAYFGFSLDSDGDRFIVGAVYDTSNGRKSGAAYLFEDKNNDGDWGDTDEVIKISHNTHGFSIAVDDAFGSAVALQGSRLIVGAGLADSNTGEVYLLEDFNLDKDYGDTGEIIKLNDDTVDDLDVSSGEVFGISATTYGDQIFISSRKGDIYEGRLHIFNDKNNDGDWNDDGELTTLGSGSDGSFEYFGSAVAVSQDRILVGAPGHITSLVSNSGSVFVLKPKFTATLTATNLSNLDEGDITISAQASDKAGNSTTSEDSFSFGLPITAPTDLDLANADDTGESNSDNVTSKTQGLTITGCAKAESTITYYDNGKEAEATTTADGATCSGVTGGRVFSHDLSLNEGRHLITTTATNGNDTSSSSIGLSILIDDTDPTAETEGLPSGLVDDDGDENNYPITIHAALDTVDLDLTFTDKDSNTVNKNNLNLNYVLTGSTTVNSAGLSTLSAGGYFGNSLDFDAESDRLLVGASQANVNGGRVYILKNKTDGVFNGTDSIVIGSSTAGINLSSNNVRFGADLAIKGNTLIVGSPGVPGIVDGSFRGQIYILKNIDDDGVPGSVTKIGDGDYGLDLSSIQSRFGYSVAYDGKRILAGNPEEGTFSTIPGAVYLFEDKNNDGDWGDEGEVIKISHQTHGFDVPTNEEFGSAVAFDGPRIIIGAAKSNVGGNGRGQVYILEDLNNDGDWGDTGEVRKINHNTDGINLDTYAGFGRSVAVSGNKLIVGANEEDSGRGSVFVLEDKNGDGAYATSTGELIIFDKDTAGLDLDNTDHFGYGLAVSDTEIFVGTPRDDTGGTNTGAVYTFALEADTTLSSANIKSLAEGTINTAVKATDLAGNLKTTTDTFIYNTSGLLTPAISAVDDDGDTFSSGDTLGIGESATVTIAFNPAISGTDTLQKSDLTLTDTGSGSWGDLYTVTAGEEYEILYTPPENIYSGTATIKLPADKVGETDNRNTLSNTFILNYNTLSAPEKPVGHDTSTFTVTRNSILFSWDDPDNHSITNYRYRVRRFVPDDEGGYGVEFLSWRDMPDSHATTTEYLLTGLDADTGYSMRIKAENIVGESSEYRFDYVTTSPPAPTPTISAVDNDGDDFDSGDTLDTGESATVTIAFNPAISGSDTLQKSDLTLTDTNSGSWGDLYTVTAGEEYEILYTPPEHISSGTATIKLLADKVGESDNRNTLSNTFTINYNTLSAPDKPVGHDTGALTITSNSILFSWDDPGNHSITKYRYKVNKYNKSHGGYFEEYLSWRDIPDSHATTTSYNLTGLEANTGYSIYLRAKNTVGESDWYNFSSVTTSPPAPTPTITATDPDGDDIDSDNPLKVGESATITIEFSPAISGSDTLTKADLTASDALTETTAGTFGDLVTVTAGEEYEILYTPHQGTNSGTTTLKLPANKVGPSDDRNIESNTFTLNYDTLAPTFVSFTTNDNEIGIGETATITIEFSEPVTNFSADDISANLFEVDQYVTESFSGSGDTYYYALTPLADKNKSIGFEAYLDDVNDIAGNGNSGFTDLLTFDFDTIRPTLTITVGTTTLTSQTPNTSVSFAFSEPVEGFTVADVDIAGDRGNIGSLSSTDNQNFTTTYYPPDYEGTTTISVSADSYSDTAGNQNTAVATLGEDIAFDVNLPMVSFTRSPSGNLKIGESTTITMTFSKPVTGFSENGITPQGGTIAGFTTISSTEYSIVFTPTPNTNNGQGSIIVKENAAYNNSDGNAANSLAAIYYDTKIETPTLTLENDSGQAGDSITNNGQINVGKIESGATWQYKLSTDTNWTTVNPGNPPYTITATEGGPHTYQARQTDAAGNQSAIATLTLTLDTKTPTLSDATIAEEGTLTPKLTLSVNHNQTATETLTSTFGGGGNCSDITVTGNISGSGTTGKTYTLTLSGEDGTYSDCSIVLTDLAGNQSNTLALTEITITTPRKRSGGVYVSRSSTQSTPYKTIQPNDTQAGTGPELNSISPSYINAGTAPEPNSLSPTEIMSLGGTAANERTTAIAVGLVRPLEPETVAVIRILPPVASGNPQAIKRRQDGIVVLNYVTKKIKELKARIEAKKARESGRQERYTTTQTPPPSAADTQERQRLQEISNVLKPLMEVISIIEARIEAKKNQQQPTR